MTDIQVANDTDIPEVQQLFREYAAWIGIDLSFQDFDRDPSRHDRVIAR